MSLTLEPTTENRSSFSGGGINLVARARPYFGLIVLTTVLLDSLRRSSRCSRCPVASIPRWPSRGSS